MNDKQINNKMKFNMATCRELARCENKGKRGKRHPPEYQLTNLLQFSLWVHTKRSPLSSSFPILFYFYEFVHELGKETFLSACLGDRNLRVVYYSACKFLEFFFLLEFFFFFSLTACNIAGDGKVRNKRVKMNV